MTTDGVRFGSDRVDSTGAEEASLLPVILFLCCLFLWWMGEALGAGCAIYLIGTGVPLIYSTLNQPEPIIYVGITFTFYIHFTF